jgi:hypothetical protein
MTYSCIDDIMRLATHVTAQPVGDGSPNMRRYSERTLRGRKITRLCGVDNADRDFQIKGIERSVQSERQRVRWSLLHRLPVCAWRDLASLPGH